VTANNRPRWVPPTSFDAQQLRERSPSLQLLLRLFVAIPLWTWTPPCVREGAGCSSSVPAMRWLSSAFRG
jgi:hypothetical protein